MPVSSPTTRDQGTDFVAWRDDALIQPTLIPEGSEHDLGDGPRAMPCALRNPEPLDPVAAAVVGTAEASAVVPTPGGDRVKPIVIIVWPHGRLGHLSPAASAASVSYRRSSTVAIEPSRVGDPPNRRLLRRLITATKRDYRAQPYPGPTRACFDGSWCLATWFHRSGRSARTT